MLSSSLVLLPAQQLRAAIVDLPEGRLIFNCTNNAEPNTFAAYSFSLNSNFEGGIVGRTIAKQLNGKEFGRDQGAVLFVREIRGNVGIRPGFSNIFTVFGAVSAVRTAPRFAVGIFPVPPLSTPCLPPPPTADAGGGDGGGGGGDSRCLPGDPICD